jgi:hypothetical protein
MNPKTRVQILFALALISVAICIFATYGFAYSKGMIAGEMVVVQSMCIDQKPLYLTEDKSKAFVCTELPLFSPQGS